MNKRIMYSTNKFGSILLIDKDGQGHVIDNTDIDNVYDKMKYFFMYGVFFERKRQELGFTVEWFDKLKEMK